MKLTSILMKTLPFLSILFILTIGCSIRIGGYPVMPALFLIPIYYWLVYCPSSLSLLALFGVGLLYDALMGREFGLSSFLLMASSLLGKSVRPLLNPHQFLLIWCGFGLYIFGYIFIYGLFTANYFPLFMGWVYGVVLYPLVAWVLSQLHLRMQAYV
ncbi:MAG: rod shape-determining protein MreD [Proteobacteria bacterium]|nr:rod shape-determining protein MreD [Pseudomonadota bacterium]